MDDFGKLALPGIDITTLEKSADAFTRQSVGTNPFSFSANSNSFVPVERNELSEVVHNTDRNGKQLTVFFQRRKFCTRYLINYVTYSGIQRYFKTYIVITHIYTHAYIYACMPAHSVTSIT